MDCCFLAVEQSGLRDRVGTSAKAPDCTTPAGFAAKPVQDRAGRRLLHVNAAANEDGVVAQDFVKTHVKLE